MGTGQPCQMCEGESWEEICGVCDGQGERPINVREWFKLNLKEAQITQIETDEATEIMIFFKFGPEFNFKPSARIDKINDAARALRIPIKSYQGNDGKNGRNYQIVKFDILGVKVNVE
jgi:hypothetical protein